VKKYVLAGLMCLILLFTCLVTLTGCGSDSSISDSKTTETNTNTDADSGKGKSVSSVNDAITIVKKLLGSGSEKYIYELDHEDQVIPDGKGNYNANRGDGKVANGIDCYIIRVFTETKQGDRIAQDNFGWYFVSKSTGKVYEMQDPYEQKLKPLN
jgi:hypothetical protein